MFTASRDGLSPSLSGFSVRLHFYRVWLSALSLPEAVFPVFSIFPSLLVPLWSASALAHTLNAAACLIVIAFCPPALIPHSLLCVGGGGSLGPLGLVYSW